MWQYFTMIMVNYDTTLHKAVLLVENLLVCRGGFVTDQFCRKFCHNLPEANICFQLAMAVSQMKWSQMLWQNEWNGQSLWQVRAIFVAPPKNFACSYNLKANLRNKTLSLTYLKPPISLRINTRLVQQFYSTAKMQLWQKMMKVL